MFSGTQTQAEKETFKKTEIKDRTFGLKSELRFKKRPEGKDIRLEYTSPSHN